MKKRWIVIIVVCVVCIAGYFSDKNQKQQNGANDITTEKQAQEDSSTEIGSQTVTESEEQTEMTESQTTTEAETEYEVQEQEPSVEELDENPISYSFDDDYVVGNISMHISEIQVRQEPYKMGSNTLEFRIFCDLTNNSNSEQLFSATKTGNVVGKFFGEEESMIGGMENLVWDKEDYNIATSCTLAAGESKSMVIQAGTTITNAVTNQDELKFDIYFKNGEELLTVSFDLQP